MEYRRKLYKNKVSAALFVIIASLFAIASALLLAGCSNMNQANVFAEDGKIHIVCTTFPQYDWVRALTAGAEERFALVLLTEGSGDLHNYQPSAMDIARVSDCDLLIYVGGESDLWVQDVLREAVNTDMRVVNMMDRIQDCLKAEEHMEGVAALGHFHEESNHQHQSGSGELEQEQDNAEMEYDEHVWLSIRNAERLVEELCVELEQLDAANADVYRKNCDRYMAELEALDNDYCMVFASPEGNTMLFADRYPFRYMAEDYGLQCFAAFDGCSAETEASFQTVVFLVEKLNELDLGTVFVIDGSDKRLAQVVIENTVDKNQQIAVLNSMQSVSKKDIERGATYLSIMKENLAVLSKSLENKQP